jgi:hypothetical protein
MGIDRDRWVVPLMAVILLAVLAGEIARAAPDAGTTAEKAGAVERDGQHDFDFEFGSWKAHVAA